MSVLGPAVSPTFLYSPQGGWAQQFACASQFAGGFSSGPGTYYPLPSMPLAQAARYWFSAKQWRVTGGVVEANNTPIYWGFSDGEPYTTPGTDIDTGWQPYGVGYDNGDPSTELATRYWCGGNLCIAPNTIERIGGFTLVDFTSSTQSVGIRRALWDIVGNPYTPYRTKVEVQIFGTTVYNNFTNSLVSGMVWDDAIPGNVFLLFGLDWDDTSSLAGDPSWDPLYYATFDGMTVPMYGDPDSFVGGITGTWTVTTRDTET